MNAVKKILGYVMALLFVYAAVVQYNDPDALLWIVLYAIAAVASILFAQGKLKFSWAAILVLVFLVIAIYHWPKEFEGVALKDGMKTINIELGRESLGMGIASLTMLVYALIIGRPKS